MFEIKNLDQKRVCDLSDDKKTLIIQKKGCVTIVKANDDGTLFVTQKRQQPATFNA